MASNLFCRYYLEKYIKNYLHSGFKVQLVSLIVNFYFARVFPQPYWEFMSIYNVVCVLNWTIWFLLLSSLFHFQPICPVIWRGSNGILRNTRSNSPCVILLISSANKLDRLMPIWKRNRLLIIIWKEICRI